MKKLLAFILITFLLAMSFAGCSRPEPITITVWHYYVAALQTEFENAVSTFNNTVGKEQGIILDSVYVENIDTLTAKIIAASENRVGADPLPDLIFAYNSTVYDLNKLGLIADLRPYFTESELEQYNPAFIEEGIIGDQNELLSFPVAKSTEVMYIEDAAYQAFKDAVNSSSQYDHIDDSMLSTFEGIMRVADTYYQWTDDKTPSVPNDGKAFFGLDATPNFVSVCARQISGKPSVTVTNGVPAFTLDKETAKILWSYYMNAIVTGRFAEIGWYRADDMKTGDLIAYLGSSGGASYFPLTLTADEKEYETKLLCLPQPVFEGKPAITLQQGAGMSVVKNNENRQKSAAQFLKWFTSPEQNVAYSIVSGYSPVMKIEYTGKLLDEELKKNENGSVLEQNIAQVLTLAAKQMDSYSLTADKEYPGSYDVRNMFGESLSETAVAARAAFVSDISTGISYQEAVQKQINDAAFESWYSGLQTNFNTLTSE